MHTLQKNKKFVKKKKKKNLSKIYTIYIKQSKEQLHNFIQIKTLK